MPAVKKIVKKKTRAKMNRYRVWFNDETSVVVKAQYPHNAYDMFPIEQRMKIDRIMDDVG